MGERLGAERQEVLVGRGLQAVGARVSAAAVQRREAELGLRGVATAAGLGLPQLERPRERGLGLGLVTGAQLEQAEPCGCRDAAEAQLGLAALYRRRADPRADDLQAAADQYFLPLGPEALAHRDRVLATLAR